MQGCLLTAARATGRSIERARKESTNRALKTAAHRARSNREALKKIRADGARVAVRLAARGTARTTSTPERFCRGGPRFCLRSDLGVDCWARDARRKASRATDVKGESAARCASCRTRAVDTSANARQGDDARPRSLHVYYLGHGLLGRAAGLGRATDGPCARPAAANSRCCSRVRLVR